MLYKMNNKEEKNSFHFVCLTEEDIKKEIQKQISELTEEQKTEFVFNGQPLYKLGRGHDFLYGFFIEYITKNGIKARCYDSNIWNIENNNYDYINSVFIERVKKERNNKPMDFNNVLFPKIKKISSRTLSEDLVSHRPFC